MATLLFLTLLPWMVLGQQQFFQLVTVEEEMCLQLQEYKGTFVACKTDSSTTFTSNTVFLTNPGSPGNRIIQIFGTKYCLDREHCHSSTSNMRYSDCDHCGAIHWTINTSDGSVREDGINNCIYNDSSGDAYIQHCTNGWQRFNVSYLGNCFQLKSVRYGDCFAGDRFINCASAPTFFTTGLPGGLNIRINGDSSNCIDREHCHSSTSNIRIYDCSHCGAIHWTIDNLHVSEDGMNNCVNRYHDDGTIMDHCSDGYEELSAIIIPNSVNIADKFMDTNPSQTSLQFSDPDPKKYSEWDLSRGLRGVRLSRCVNHEALRPVMELEFVHNLPYTIPNAHYMITRIHVDIPYSESLSIFDIMNRIVKDNDLISMYKIYYGVMGALVTNNDGLLSNFVTEADSRGVPITGYTATTISRLSQGLKNSAFHNDQYYESFYVGQNSYQWYLDFIDKGSISLPLYWPKELSEVHSDGKPYDNGGIIQKMQEL